MATEIRVPTLGESVAEATVGKWFKAAGDAIAVDEPIVELETDKVTIEVPAPAAGTLSEIVVKEGETVEVGALLGMIGEGEGAPAKKAEEKPAAAEAPKHVFGYAVGNDVSVRDWQTKTAQWVLGKSFDTHGPIGPVLVTADELGEPHGLRIQSFVNGELRQNSNTRHLVFNVWAQIEELSKVMTLKPGDVIFTGTPGGVGLAFKPPRFLREGDVVRCEIEKLGAIENRVVAEA